MKGVIPSPNIWHHPAVYEAENRGVDHDGVIEAAMREVRDWAGATVLDIGCGTGFHLPRWAQTAACTIGVEPHPPLVALAQRRLASLSAGARLGEIAVRRGTAQELPVADRSIDVAHARWAYFFGPGCEPGLAELNRVMRTGGVAFIIDNDASRSTFGRWFAQAVPSIDPVQIERFWSLQGFTRVPLTISWQMASREQFEAVIGIEFAPEQAREILAEHRGSSVDYAVNLFWKRYP